MTTQSLLDRFWVEFGSFLDLFWTWRRKLAEEAGRGSQMRKLEEEAGGGSQRSKLEEEATGVSWRRNLEEETGGGSWSQLAQEAEGRSIFQNTSKAMSRKTCSARSCGIGSAGHCFSRYRGSAALRNTSICPAKPVPQDLAEHDLRDIAFAAIGVVRPCATQAFVRTLQRQCPAKPVPQDLAEQNLRDIASPAIGVVRPCNTVRTPSAQALFGEQHTNENENELRFKTQNRGCARLWLEVVQALHACHLRRQSANEGNVRRLTGAM
jgi:hypothetical protein